MNAVRIFYNADTPSAPAAGSPAPAKTIHTPKLPRKDITFGAVAANVAAKWKATPAITLIWADAAGFEAKANQYNTALSGRKSAGSGRGSQAQALDALDDKIEEGISRVKKYIQEKWEEEEAAFAQYTRYGMMKQSKNYILPRDRQLRLAALKLVQAAIAADGFDKKTYGTAFWTDTYNQYAAALKAASDTDSTVSLGVSSKNVLRAELTGVMEALQLVIRGNYPQTFAAEYRAWGWQKEDY